MSTRIEKDFEFQSALHFEEQFLLNHFNITLSIIVETDLLREQNVAMERLEHFIYRMLDNGIFVNEIETDMIELYKNAGLKIITLPEEPFDQIIGMALIQKFNTIMENRLVVTDLLIGSKLSDGVRFTIIGEVSDTIMKNESWYNRNSLCINNFDDKSDKASKIVKLFENDWAALDLNWKEKVPKGKKTT